MKTAYYGRKVGAVVEKKGKRLTVTIGRVYRYTASEQAMGSGLLKFFPKTVLLNKEAAPIATYLSAIKVANWRLNVTPERGLDDYDGALQKFTA